MLRLFFIVRKLLTGTFGINCLFIPNAIIQLGSTWVCSFFIIVMLISFLNTIQTGFGNQLLIDKLNEQTGKWKDVKKSRGIETKGLTDSGLRDGECVRKYWPGVLCLRLRGLLLHFSGSESHAMLAAYNTR